VHDTIHPFAPLQGSVATHTRCGGIFNKYLAANVLENLIAKIIENRLRINSVTAMSVVSPFVGHGVQGGPKNGASDS